MSVPRFIVIGPVPRPWDANPQRTLQDVLNETARKHLGEDGSRYFSTRAGKLREIDPQLLQCDCMVSPANSWGLMDGGYDMELSTVFQGAGLGEMRLSRHVQKALRARWFGYAPPTSCTLVELPEDVSGSTKNPWGARVLAVVPTMRYPEDVRWHRDLVYNCMWTLLVEIAQWNAVRGPEEQLRTVVMTGLGTGIGKISVERCAEQMVLAVKHFARGVPEKADWTDVEDPCEEIQQSAAL